MGKLFVQLNNVDTFGGHSGKIHWCEKTDGRHLRYPHTRKGFRFHCQGIWNEWNFYDKHQVKIIDENDINWDDLFLTNKETDFCKKCLNMLRKEKGNYMQFQTEQHGDMFKIISGPHQGSFLQFVRR